ncbi:MAG TPA: thiamine pyrophosphate-dependent enzyme [Terriglobales bacterium]|nr:thiamine pyrophosphate-dependent enzyme [Terriglobales bacterium]
MTTGTEQITQLLSGDEAVALAAFDAGLALGTGYPGTPSTEILEYLDHLGGKAQWAPNEKVALEVAIGVAFAGGRAIATMKHVGLNVAADPLFTVAYMDVKGALVIVSADDPGMASSQNEQDNRRYAVAAGVPMFEPSDSQEAYDFTLKAIEVSERWSVPVLLRLTTRVCHSKTLVKRADPGTIKPAPKPHYEHDLKTHVMIPAHARPAHQRLRAKLAQMAEWNEQDGPNQLVPGYTSLGIITSGISYQHVREAAPDASVLKLGMTYPLPLELVRKFAASVERCVVVEEGDPYLVEGARMAGINVENKPEMYRFGELNVNRVRRIISGDTSPEPKPLPGKPPALCPGCPHRNAYTGLKDLDTIVAGDIGCYSLGVLPPFEAMHISVCMGASLGVALGMRHVLPPEQAKRVVSVIGDSTFIHSGITGVVEMVYNPPPTGHVLVILDNGITAMTGMQEHPATGRTLDHARTGKVVLEDLCRALGVKNVHVIDGTMDPMGLEKLIKEAIEKPELTIIVNRRACLLAAKAIKEYERINEQQPCN